MSGKRQRGRVAPALETPIKRCAIYTRKSIAAGLEQEFNSLDAQREAGENFVQAQASQGWQVLPELYDDGGFTGFQDGGVGVEDLLFYLNRWNSGC